MKLFLWYAVEGIFEPAHDLAGLVIVAENMGEALTGWHEYCEGTSRRNACRDLPKPDRSYEVDPYSKSEIIILANAGAA